MPRMISRRFALRASPAVLLGGFAAASLRAEPQPNMEAALRSLREALASLQKASSDKGGHRLKAEDYVKRAIAEVETGIAYANKQHR